MASLEQDGLVRRVHGKGTFVHEDAGQRLQNGRALFALLVPETQAGFYPSLQHSFEKEATEHHRQVIVCNSNNDVDKQGNLILQLIHHRVAGVAIVPTTRPKTPQLHIEQLQRHGIPVVCCSRRVTGAQTPLLAIPFEAIGRLAGREIAAAGHRRIAFLGTSRSEAAVAYERGLRSELDRIGAGDVSVRTIFGTTASPGMHLREPEVSAALEELFGDEQVPTAIFASFDSLAELVYVLLGRRGLRVPEDVSLIGVGGSRRQGGLQHQLTSIVLDEVAMGREAADLLHRMASGELLPIHSEETRVIPISLFEGQTLRPLSRQESPDVSFT